MPATPNSQLWKKYQMEIKRQGFKIKVVEKAKSLIHSNRGNVGERTAQYVGRRGKDRAIEKV